MTREDIDRIASEYFDDKESDHEMDEVFDLAKKALEQAPCHDAISRQAVLEAIEDDKRDAHYSCFASNNDAECFKQIIRELPPVTPQPKTGHWIKSRDCYGTNHFTCPFCGHDIATKYNGAWEDNYCSNCGAKMESEGRLIDERDSD